MFKFIYDYFLKKISFSDELIKDIQSLSGIDWLANIGQPLNEINCIYNITQVASSTEALKYLQYEMSPRGFLTLNDLLNEGSNRSAGYLSDFRQREFDTEWNEVSKKANEYIDIELLKAFESEFNQKYKSNVNLHLLEYIYDYIHCLYFKKDDSEFPTFALDVFDIYKKGHIIVAFKYNNPKGRFISSYNEKFSPKDGTILIW